MPKIITPKKIFNRTLGEIGRERNTPHTFIGIDPGMSGGIAFLNTRGEVICTKMPDTERDIWETIRSVWTISLGRCVGVIEKVHSMPGQGVSSTFKFGCIYGQLRMCLVAADIPFEDCTPQRWQKALNIVPRGKDESKTDFKNRLKARAQNEFPKEKVTLATADSLLIALFCKRKHEGTL